MRRDTKKQQAFTLIELLAVVAIVGVLLAIAMPVYSSGKTSVLKLKTRQQFSAYVLALEEYEQEYGKFPEFLLSEDGTTVNLKDEAKSFVEALEGVKPNKYNPKGIAFHSFSQNEFTKEGVICDAFGNSEIFIGVDSDEDGLVDGEHLPSRHPIHARVIVFTKKQDGEVIESW